MSKVEFEHTTFEGSEPVRMDYERKLPEPTVWMTPSGEGFMMRWKPPVTEVAMGWDAMFTEAQLREALAQQAEELKHLQEQNTALDAKLASHEDVMRQALNFLGPTAPECSGCEYEWNEAIKALEGALK